jgi:hypothetical protein
MRGVISIIIGLVMIVAGLSGKIVLKGTQSGMGYAALGAVVLVIGLVRLSRNRA